MSSRGSNKIDILHNPQKTLSTVCGARISTMVETHPLVLSLRSAGLKDIDPCNIEDVHNMWHAFSKAKHCIDGGDRFEYLSWRLYSREVLVRGKPREQAPTEKAQLEESSPLASEADSSGDNASDGSEDWEFESEGSSASDDDSAGRSPKSPPRLGDTNACEHHNDSASYGHKHRRISSLELQNLFKESNGPISSEVSRPVQEFPLKATNKQPLKTILKKSSTASPEPQGPVHHARFRSPQFESRNEDFRSTSRSDTVEPKSIPSSVIRGFSPSNVSVSVSSKHGRDELNPLSVASEMRNFDNDQTRTANGSAVEKPDSRKMFYICAADSDTESSNMGSPYNRVQKLKDTANEHEAPSESPEQAENIAADIESPMGSQVDFTEGSEWADTSDEEFEDENTEESRQEMFKERAVPTKPLLKRSLLSSLFVKDIKDGSPAQSESSVDSSEQPLNSKENSAAVKAPVDILLGAPLAPHFPLASEQSMLNDESFETSSTNIIGGGIMEQREQEQMQQQLSRSLEARNLTPTHITGRPEIYRASTDTSTFRPHSDATTPTQNSWANQHEDIYDPMNYHSRGW